MEHAALVRAAGGRRGRVWTDSGSINSAVVMPGSAASGVTPEELLAAAWGACYGSAYAAEARAEGIAPDPHLVVEVVLDVDEGVYTISRASLTVLADGDQEAAAREVAGRAHARCPISKVFEVGISDVRVATGSDC